jgi:hypothetical protein
MDVRSLTSRIGNSSSSFLYEIYDDAVTAASADVVNGDRVDLTTPFSRDDQKFDRRSRAAHI